MKKNSQNRSQVKTFWHSVGQMEREARDHCIFKNNFLLSSMILVSLNFEIQSATICRTQCLSILVF